MLLSGFPLSLYALELTLPSGLMLSRVRRRKSVSSFAMCSRSNSFPLSSQYEDTLYHDESIVP